MTLMSILLALVGAIAFALAIMLYLMTLPKKRPYDPIEFPPPETRVTTVYSDYVNKGEL